MSRKTKLRACVFVVLTGFFLFEASAQSFRQNTRPSLGLVLSGGGAKGFAHIGAIKVFEEAGLQFDYIGGTSMGSIVGSLYALGYRPDSIAAIIQRQDWDAIINDKIPRKYVPVEDKQYYDRFIVTFPIIERKLKVRLGLHSGQLVNILLAKYLSPAYMITDFTKLPIPFLCIATDLSTGNNIVIQSGSLHQAVRASMSIPGYFTPTVINDQVLVDGGVVNNYPVAEVKAAGADIIIGVDVQSGLYSPEELTSMPAILDQVSSFYRLSSNELGIKLTDIYIKPELEAYSMMSFDGYEALMKIGEQAARKVLPQLKQLADSLDAFGKVEPRNLNTQPLDSIYLHFVQYNGLQKVSVEFMDGLLEVRPNKWMKPSVLSENLKRAYGSGFFESIDFYISSLNNQQGIVFNVQEASSGLLAVGPHYDSDYRASLFLYGSLKNLGSKDSKLSVALNLGENPMLRGQYLVGRGSNIGYGLEVESFNLRMNQYHQNKIIDVFNLLRYKFSPFFQWSFHNSLGIKTGISFESTAVTSNFSTDLPEGFNTNLIPYLNFYFDTYNKTQFPTNGSLVSLSAKYIHNINKSLADELNKNVIVMQLKYHKLFPVISHHVLKTGITAGFTLKDRLASMQHRFIVGGQSNITYLDSFLPFTGLRFIELTGLHTTITHFAWQYNFLPDLYATFKLDFGVISSTWNTFLTNPQLISGYGISLGYESVIGPFEISIMGCNINKGISSFFNIGYWF